MFDSWSLRCRSCCAHFLGLLAFLFSAAAFLLPSHAAAQKESYEEWRQKQRQEYGKFLTRQDEAFLKFLKQEWTRVEVDAAAVSPIDNKPRQIPRVNANDVPPETLGKEPSKPDLPRDDTRRKPSSSTDRSSQNENSAPTKDPLVEDGGSESSPNPKVGSNLTENRSPAPEQREGPPESLEREASFSFFGTSATVPYRSAAAPRLEGAPSKSSIRHFWKKMAKGPYRPTLGAIQKQREELGLSDWGYYLYLRRLSGQLYGDESPNEQALWTWFALMKSGYAARVGYRQGEVFLMLPVEEKIFSRPQMHIGGQRYYLMVEAGGGSLRTYEGQHEGARRAFRLDEKTLPDLGSESRTRAVEFSFQGQRRSLEISYSPATAEYLRAYPDVELRVLMEAGVSPTAEASLKKALRPLLADLGPRASANLLLKFSQFATGYKRDREHFGEERYLFPEESLASDYSDCEDRAVLLAYLVRELLGREVIGLQWPNHVALAVRAEGELSATGSDQTVTNGGDTYIYADPTYLGSDIGMKMPLVEGQEPETISVGK